MSQTQIEEFLEVPRFAFVGTNRPDGPPQLTPMWYLYENGRMYFSMGVESVKHRNLRRDPRIGICIAGNHPDARAVMLYGTVELFLKAGAAWIEEIEWRLVRRYHNSDEEAHSYMESEGAGGEAVLAVVTPARVIAQDYN